MTLAIVIASTAFLQIRGRHIVREHFGAMGGRNLELTPRQAAVVAIFLTSCIFYVLWLGM